jgi:RNA polymerase sigma-70 factor, ECF subfamily
MTIDRRKLINTARRLLDSRAEAEDVVQDTYVRGFDTFSDWRVPEPAWMYVVLRNAAIDRQRRRKMESLHADAALGDGSQSSREPSLEAESECEAAIRRLLSRVRVSEAAALLLRDVFEFDYQEIAEMLGKSESTTRQAVHRIRLRTRRPEASHDAEESSVALICRAIEAREPAPLLEMLQGITVRAKASATAVGGENGAGSSSVLVQVEGGYALAVVLGGVVLCVVPVGVRAARSRETA